MKPMPVVVAARQVRLSPAHMELLFGAGVALVDICDVPPTATFASAHVVDVRGPAGTLKNVRVMGPLVRQTEVRLKAADAAVVGVTKGVGCTLEGPRGTVVLAGGVKVGLRQLVLSAKAANDASLVEGALTTVIVRGDRERELRDIPVVVDGAGAEGWLELDVDDANALEVGPSTAAFLEDAISSRA